MTLREPTFSVGVEEEYLLVDRETRDLVGEPPPELIDRFEQELGGHFSSEFLRPQVEVGTPVRDSTAELRADLERLRRTVAGIAADYGLGLIAASTHPFARWRDQKHTDKPRYNILERDMQVVARRLLICGMHVHVGIEDDELRIDILNQVPYFLPHLLALSTSSPFWEGTDTGLQSYRVCVFDESPRTGLPELFESHDQYRRTLDLMISAGLIEDASKLWWDVRPSARFPTLEMRVTDVCTRLEDALCCAALFRCVCRLLYRLRRDNQRWRVYSRTLVDENRWRAQRYGIDEGLGRLRPRRDRALPAAGGGAAGGDPGGRGALRLRRGGGARPRHRGARDQLPHAGGRLPRGDRLRRRARGGPAGGGGRPHGGHAGGVPGGEESRSSMPSVSHTTRNLNLKESTVMSFILSAFAFVMVVLATPPAAEAVDPGDYDVPVSTAQQVRLGGTYAYASTGSYTETNNGSAWLRYHRYYNSLPYAWDLNFRGVGETRRTYEDKQKGSYEFVAFPGIRKYFDPAGDLFYSGELSIRGKSDFDRPGIDITPGVGSGTLHSRHPPRAGGAHPGVPDRGRGHQGTPAGRDADRAGAGHRTEGRVRSKVRRPLRGQVVEGDGADRAGVGAVRPRRTGRGRFVAGVRGAVRGTRERALYGMGRARGPAFPGRDNRHEHRPPGSRTVSALPLVAAGGMGLAGRRER